MEPEKPPKVVIPLPHNSELLVSHPSKIDEKYAILCFRDLIYSPEYQEKRLKEWDNKCALGNYFSLLGRDEGLEHILPGLWVYDMVDYMDPAVPYVRQSTLTETTRQFWNAHPSEASRNALGKLSKANRDVAIVVDKHFGHDPSKVYNAAVAYLAMETEINRKVNQTLLNQLANNN